MMELNPDLLCRVDKFIPAGEVCCKGIIELKQQGGRLD